MIDPETAEIQKKMGAVRNLETIRDNIVSQLDSHIKHVGDNGSSDDVNDFANRLQTLYHRLWKALYQWRSDRNL